MFHTNFFNVKLRHLSTDLPELKPRQLFIDKHVHRRPKTWRLQLSLIAVANVVSLVFLCISDPLKATLQLNESECLSPPPPPPPPVSSPPPPPCPPPLCALSAAVIEFLWGASLRVFCPSLVGELNQLDTLMAMLGQKEEPRWGLEGALVWLFAQTSWIARLLVAAAALSVTITR